jgi:hypothetical protein
MIDDPVNKQVDRYNYIKSRLKSAALSADRMARNTVTSGQCHVGSGLPPQRVINLHGFVQRQTTTRTLLLFQF